MKKKISEGRAQNTPPHVKHINSTVSQTIDCLRFPMALLVIYIHQDVIICEDPHLISEYYSNLLTAIFVTVTPKIAVPLFFLISGYLYFFNVRRFDWQQYKDKTRKRFKTLILPYLYWNVVALFALIVVKALAVIVKHKPLTTFTDYISTFNLSVFWDFNQWTTTNWCFGLYPAEMTAPLDYPLWFVRNLIVLLLISPIIYILIRRLGKLTVVLLSLCYLSNIWFQIPFLNITGVCFFALGAYWGYNKENISELIIQYKTPLIILCLMCYVASLILFTMALKQAELIILQFYIMAGVLMTIAFMSQYIDRGHDTTILHRYANASFFIFAIHTIFITTLSSKLLNKCLGIFGSEIVAYSGQLLLEPLLNVVLCLTVFYILKRYTPMLLSHLTGNRY